LLTSRKRCCNGCDRDGVEQHLLVCPPCTLHVRQVRDTIAIARETRPTTAAPAAALDILRRWKAES